MNHVKNFQCTLCEKVYDDLSLLTCPECGEIGILEINYDYSSMKKEVTKEYFKSNKDYSIYRYLPMLSINTKLDNSLKVGWTPLYKSVNLAKKLGVKDLYIKDEGLNPTASLKDRASLIACVKAIEEGKQVISCSSTGNAASSLAGNAAKLGLDTVIFVPERAPLGKISQLLIYGSNLIKVKGDYKGTFTSSKITIDKFGFYNRNAAINPHLVEGKKTVALEIAEQLDFKPIDNVFVSVGDGCTIYGVYKGFYDLKSLGIIDYIPRIVGVQSEGCSPFYDAWKNETNLQETDENTIADSIAVGIPRNPVKGLKAVIKSKGFFMTVTDRQILQAMATLGNNEGVFAEPAASAVYAGFEKAVLNNLIDKNDVSVVIVTGNGLKDQLSASKVVDVKFNLSKEDLKKKIDRRNQDDVSLDDFLQLIES
jgi:threonine synthase